MTASLNNLVPTGRRYIFTGKHDYNGRPSDECIEYGGPLIGHTYLEVTLVSAGRENRDPNNNLIAVYDYDMHWPSEVKGLYVGEKADFELVN